MAGLNTRQASNYSTSYSYRANGLLQLHCAKADARDLLVGGVAAETRFRALLN